MKYIGIDIGTTSIKGAILDLETLTPHSIHHVPFPEPVRGLPAQYHEFNPNEVLAAVGDLMLNLVSLSGDCDGIVMCSQMHDLIFTDHQGHALSNLISWQDQRVLMPHPSGKGTYFDHLKSRIDPADQRLLGNELRPGQPIGQLFWLAEQNELLTGDVYPASLPDFFLSNLCGTPPVTEITHAMSHGTLNLKTLDWHYGVLSQLGLDGLHWPAIQPQGAVAAIVTVNGKKIPCYTPVGDYQAALAGALIREGELSLNISTGSQVSLLSPNAEFGDFQTRPFFDGQFLKTITHIPAGRSLNHLVRLLSELANSQQVELTDPWPYIANAAAEAQNHELRVNLAFFNSSCGDHGSITGIREEELTIGHLFRGAFQNMADNYYASALRLSAEKEWCRLVFSGGLAQKIPLLRELIREKFQVSDRLCPTMEDTLSGLLTLALVCSGRMPDVAGAMRLLQQKEEHL